MIWSIPGADHCAPLRISSSWKKTSTRPHGRSPVLPNEVQDHAAQILAQSQTPSTAMWKASTFLPNHHV
ncbi:hypothetical protein EYF80_006970 [Liparis tanakae]|uniref:Uncharacterized protein n=1 Tax=Liparis tanakae TaxID=230148 RepID=A0A4Z2IXL2_9TELE|nr:hypothetical protein EYF80_006970 [Liparis tanakae]